MTRIIALLLALLMLFALCTAEAEEGDGMPDLQNMTVGELRDAMEDNLRMSVFGEDYFAYLLYVNGKHYRVFVYGDDTYKALFKGMSDDATARESNAKLETYIKDMPVGKVEEITAQPLDKEKLDALTGKTVNELADNGWSLYSVWVPAANDSELGQWNITPVNHSSAYIASELPFRPMYTDSLNKVTVEMHHGMFQYSVLIDATYDEFMELVTSGKDVWKVKVTGVECIGFSGNFSSEGLYPDGTVRHWGVD